MEGRATLLDRILLVVVVETLDTAQEVLLLASEPVASSLNQEETGRQSSVGGTPSPSLLSKTEYQTFLAIYKVRPRAPEHGKVGIYIYIPGGAPSFGETSLTRRTPLFNSGERERERERAGLGVVTVFAVLSTSEYVVCTPVAGSDDSLCPLEG